MQKHVNGKMRKKSRLFYATDFQSLMYPCFTFCRILGIFPYKINASTFEISKPCYILSTIIICIYCAFYLLLIHSIIISENTITFGDVEKLATICYFTLNGFIAIITHIMSNPRKRLLQTISEISSKLPSESYQKLSRLVHVKDIFGTMLVIMQGYVFFSKVTYELNCLNILTMTFGMYMMLIVYQTNMLYINCLCILKACYKKINDDLKHMQKIINDMKSYIPSLICHIQRNQFFLMELKILMKQHLMINRTVQMLNITFSLQLLATITGSFSEITYEIYSYAVRWQGEVQITFDRYLLDVFLVTMAHYIIKITLLVWACETGKNQAQKIKTTIYDVVNSTRDEQIKAELHLFSLQILHCENIFSVKGLTVNATLLTAMVGSITTYILILIQFLITAHSCDGKSTINVT